MDLELEDLVKEFGEKYRMMISDALDWLRGTEPTWKLETQINRHVFVADLVRKVK